MSPQARVSHKELPQFYDTTQLPSAYSSKFHYACLTGSEPTLRWFIDTVGLARVVIGTDWPSYMAIDYGHRLAGFLGFRVGEPDLG